MTDPNPDPRYVYHDMDPCPRCGGKHLALQFTKFAKPVDYRAHGTSVRADHWGLCPGTSEPIILLETALPVSQT